MAWASSLSSGSGRCACRSGAQDVRQDDRVTVVGLTACGRVAVPVAGHRHRVDRVDLAAGGAQAGGQQAARCLDRHRDRVFGAVAVGGEQFQQPGKAGRVVADPGAGEQPAVPACEGDVVVVLRPVDPAEYVQLKPPSPQSAAVRAGQGRAGHARSLMEGLKGTAIRLAVRDPGCPQAPVLARARRLPALMRGRSCRWLRPRPPVPARTADFTQAARRVARQHRRSPAGAGTRIFDERSSPGDVHGSPGTSRTSQVCQPWSRRPAPRSLRASTGKQTPQPRTKAPASGTSSGALP